jgi:uncharacterized protein YraI
MALSRRLALAFAAASLFVLADAAHAQGAVVNRNVNMRAGPDRVFPLVAWLPAGTRVRVFGCTSNWRWCDVARGRDRGWVHSAYLSNVSRRGTPVISFSIGPYWDLHYRGRPWFGSRPQWDGWGTPSFRPPPPPPPRPPRPGRPPPPRPR